MGGTGSESLRVRDEVRRVQAGFGIWIWGPVAAFALLWVAILSVPGADCDGFGDDTAVGDTIILTVAGVAGLACLAAAVQRVVVLWRRHRMGQWQVLASLAVLGALLLFALALDIGGGGLDYWNVAIVGNVICLAALLALVGTWVSGLGKDDVGLLLPVYLLSAAAFVYPGFGLLAAALNSGALC